MNLDKSSALRIVKKTLTADYACEEADLDRDGTFIREAREVEGRRRFPSRGKRLGIVTLGVGVVVCCDAERMEWTKGTLGHLSRDDVFSAQTIAILEQFLASEGQFATGPDLKYVCSTDTFRSANWSDLGEISVELVERADLEELYAYEGFRNALSYRARREELATVARRSGAVIGIAGASADSDSMWQIGIDVVPSAQRLGLGKSLASLLTKEILNREKVPYYSTVTSNLPSRALATGIGYWPAWVEIGARNKG